MRGGRRVLRPGASAGRHFAGTPTRSLHARDAGRYLRCAGSVAHRASRRPTPPANSRAGPRALSVAATAPEQALRGWIVATPFAVQITSYPEVDISVPFDWDATAADVTERVRAAMED